MAEQRDMLDDLIDISDSWQALSNPFGGVMDTLTQDPSKIKKWDPSEYKEVPRPNAVTCLQITSQSIEVLDKGVVYSDGTSLRALNASGRQTWSYVVGAGCGFSSAAAAVRSSCVSAASAAW